MSRILFWLNEGGGASTEWLLSASGPVRIQGTTPFDSVDYGEIGSSGSVWIGGTGGFEVDYVIDAGGVIRLRSPEAITAQEVVYLASYLGQAVALGSPIVQTLNFASPMTPTVGLGSVLARELLLTSTLKTSATLDSLLDLESAVTTPSVWST